MGKGKVSYIYNRNLFILKIEENPSILQYLITWMYLEDIMQSEMSVKERLIRHLIIKCVQVENRMIVGTWGRKSGKLWANKF
jgi:hypothetical protein